MTVYGGCCPFLQLLLVTVSTEVSLGTENIKHVTSCRGDSVRLFQDVKIDNHTRTVSLYKSKTMIFMWSMKDNVTTPSPSNNNSEKFFLDKIRNIWILHLRESDAATYTVKYLGNNPEEKVRLEVLVGPENSCKPTIKLGVGTLTTYIEASGCGTPASSAYWLEQPNIYIERNVIKLQPGQSAGTVYACIYGPALKCANSSKLSDYCTVFIHESNIQPQLTKLSTITISTLSASIVAGAAGIVLIIIQCKKPVLMPKKIENSIRLSELKLLDIERLLNRIVENGERNTDEPLETLEETEPSTSALSRESDETNILLEALSTRNDTTPKKLR